MLEEDVESSQDMCTRLISYLNHADILPPDQLPLEAPLVFYGERMWCINAASWGHLNM